MNIQRIESLLKQIETADVITVDDSPLLSNVQDVSLVEGIPDNEVLYISWVCGEGQECAVKITEDGLDKAHFKDNQITCEDHEGTHTVISLFKLTADPVIKNWA